MQTSDTIDAVLKQKAINNILSVTPEQNVRQALELMAEHNIGALMVMEGKRLIGILSERDYARKGILKGHHSENTLVREIMSSHVVSVRPNILWRIA